MGKEPDNLPSLLTLAHDVMEMTRRPSGARLRGVSLSLRKLWMEFDRLIAVDGFLCRSVTSSLTGDRLTQIVVTSALVPDVLQQLHGGPASAHFSAERVWERARPNLLLAIYVQGHQDMVRAVQSMPDTPVSSDPHRALMGGSQATRPSFERVAADILELPVPTKGNRYVLVVEDYFTKFVNLYALPNQTAQTVTPL